MPVEFVGGKLPKQYDRRNLSLNSYVAHLTPPPDHSDPGRSVTVPWGQLGNDQVGDCAFAGAGHAEMTWSAHYTHQQLTLNADEILDHYSFLTKYVPGDKTTDKGAALLSVLKFWNSMGIAGQKIGGFAEISPHDEVNIKRAIDLFGGAYVGLRLPSAVIPKGGAVRPFTVSRRFYDPATWRNEFNGHCVVYVAYDPAGLTCVTWGQTNRVSWKFHRAYCDEAYAILAPEIVDGSAAPDGFNCDQLRQDIERVGSIPPAKPAASTSRG